MGLPSRELPATLLDCFAMQEPEFARLARLDAAELAAAGHECGFMRLEDVPTRFFSLLGTRIDREIRALARSHGVDEEAARHLWQAALPARRGYYDKLELLYHLILSLELGGGKIFRIAAPLVERLSQTDIDVPAEELRLPFPSLMLVYDDDVSFSLFHEGNPFGKAPRSGALSSILVDIPGPDGRRLLAGTVHGRGRNFHGMIHRSMRYGEGSLERMLTTSWPGDPTYTSHAGQPFNRLVLNTLLYIASRDARIGPPAKTIGRPAPLVKSKRVHCVVGDGLLPFRPPTDRNPQVAHTSHVDRQLFSRHMVRGHWKLQAHGEGRSSRRLVWIAPYVRGPQLAEMLNRPRLVR